MTIPELPASRQTGSRTDDAAGPPARRLGVEIRPLLPALSSGRRWYHTQAYIRWVLPEGCSFRKGDELYVLTHCSVFDDGFPEFLCGILSRFFPNAAVSHRAEGPGILLRITAGNGVFISYDPFVAAEYLSVEDWEGFLGLLRGHEAAARHWKSTGHYPEEAGTPLKDLQGENDALRREAIALENELAALSLQEREIRSRIGELRRSAAQLAAETDRPVASPVPRQLAFLRGRTAAEIVALLLSRPGGCLPAVSGSAGPADAKLVEALSRRIAAFLSPGIPLEPSLLCRIWPDWERLSAFAAEFARFDREALAVAGDAALTDAERRSRWRALRQELTRYANAAFPDPHPLPGGSPP